MSTKYKATDLNGVYFITITTVGWVDVFTRLNQKHVIIDALSYCQTNKGLKIYAYVLMHSHLHMICKTDGKLTLAEVMRDFKKYTSKKIIQTIITEPESRREWMLNYFGNVTSHLKRSQHYKVWQEGYHAELVYSDIFLKEKMNYIHQNPVKEKLVVHVEDYYFSSARNYSGLSNDLEVELVFI